MAKKTRQRGFKPVEGDEIARLTVHGAAGGVTGSCYLLETAKTRLLIECGMFQGRRAEEARNRRPFPFDPRGIDAVVLTHAHLDHTGLTPKLVKGKFRGKIHATAPTCDLLKILWPDSAHIQEHDAKRENRRSRRRGGRVVEPLYSGEDAQTALGLLEPHRFAREIDIAEDVRVCFRRAGHILGSSSVELWVRSEGVERKVVFSGDLGRATEPILRDPDPPEAADLLFLESTYGDRDHRGLDESLAEFRKIVTDAAKAGENVIVPSFAVGRAQEILYYLSRFERERGAVIPPVYLDSPMAIHVTELYGRHKDCFDGPVRDVIAHGGDPLEPSDFHFCRTPDDSRALNNKRGIVILSASGMCTAGRVVHHLKHHLWRTGSHVVLVGFQAQGTTGRALVDRARKVRVLGEQIAVRANIHTLGGFSAHAGQTQLRRWAKAILESGARLALVHGESEKRKALAGRMEGSCSHPIRLPELGEVASFRRRGEPIIWQDPPAPRKGRG
jgi:metallo-beta-lactamase family protein